MFHLVSYGCQIYSYEVIKIQLMYNNHATNIFVQSYAVYLFNSPVLFKKKALEK